MSDTTQNAETDLEPDPYESDPHRAREGRNLSREAMKYRLRLRAAEAEITALKTKIAGTPAPSGTPSDESEVKAVDTAFTDEDDEYQEIERMHGELQSAALEQQLTAAGALYPRELRELLEARGQLVTDDGEFAVLVNGEPMPLSSESLMKITRGEWMRSTGLPGTGSRGGAARGMGLDYQRGLTDVAYFAKHRDQMLAEYRRRQQG